MSRRLPLLAISLLICIGASKAHAEVIVNFAFDGSVDTSSDTNSDSNASNFVFDAGLSGSSFGSPSPGFSANVPTGGGTHSRFTRTYVTANDIAGAIANNDFASFTVTANAGMQLNLTSFTMALGSTGVNANGAGDPTTSNTSSFALHSSVDGFANTIGTLSVTAPDGATVWSTGSIDLSGTAFQGLSSVTFRVYMFVNGSVVTAVPEPTSFALLGLAAGIGMWRRKGKQRLGFAS
jgi:hypothetical protein